MGPTFVSLLLCDIRVRNTANDGNCSHELAATMGFASAPSSSLSSSVENLENFPEHVLQLVCLHKPCLPLCVVRACPFATPPWKHRQHKRDCLGFGSMGHRACEHLGFLFGRRRIAFINIHQLKSISGLSLCCSSDLFMACLVNGADTCQELIGSRVVAFAIARMAIAFMNLLPLWALIVAEISITQGMLSWTDRVCRLDPLVVVESRKG